MSKLFRKALSMTLVLIMVLGLAANGLTVYAANNDGGSGLQAQALQPLTLLEGSASWKYADDGSDQGTVWQAVYDDSTWKSGQAPLGYKDDGSGISTAEFGPLKTEISYGGDKSNKYMTSYFRTHLNVNTAQLGAYNRIMGSFGDY
jgi:hypothetical protein